MSGAVGELIPVDTADEGAARCDAVDVLVWGLPLDQQPVGERVFLDKLAEVYRASGVEPPAWTGTGGGWNSSRRVIITWDIQ